jgi:hypothetical protein
MELKEKKDAFGYDEGFVKDILRNACQHCQEVSMFHNEAEDKA